MKVKLKLADLKAERRKDIELRLMKAYNFEKPKVTKRVIDAKSEYNFLIMRTGLK